MVGVLGFHVARYAASSEVMITRKRIVCQQCATEGLKPRALLTISGISASPFVPFDDRLTSSPRRIDEDYMRLKNRQYVEIEMNRKELTWD